MLLRDFLILLPRTGSEWFEDMDARFSTKMGSVVIVSTPTLGRSWIERAWHEWHEPGERYRTSSFT